MAGTADKDYFLDINGKVTADEEKAHSLLIRKGQDIPKEMADKYGIGSAKSAKAASAPAEDGEKANKPASNKSAAPAKNK
jgi:hypothetical protein